MRTGEAMRTLRGALAALALLAAAAAQAAEGGREGVVDWQKWAAGTEITNLPSLQRGAANFMNYCSGCHSLKYVRYLRLGRDLRIPEAQLREHLVAPGAKPTDYLLTSMPPADGEAWFGKAPPDLSLMVRARGADYIYRFLKTYYVDATNPATGVDNLQLPDTAMPHVLAELEGLKRAVFRNVEQRGEGGEVTTVPAFERFETVTPGQLSAEEYDGFVRDIVNFLDYASDPSQSVRKSVGVWVLLFLLAFTFISWLLYKEYWKDVH